MAGPQEEGPMSRPQINRRRVLLESWNEFLNATALHGCKYFVGTRFIAKAFWVKMIFYFSDTFYRGDPNQNSLFQMAVPLKLCISDPMLVKPKCV